MGRKWGEGEEGFEQQTWDTTKDDIMTGKKNKKSLRLGYHLNPKLNLNMIM